MADDTRSDPVALFKDAFGPDSTDTSRSAALGIMMQNPQGFVSGLVELLGSFTAVQFLTKMSDVSAPEPLRKAAGGELGRLASASMESKRLDSHRLEFLDVGWGEPSILGTAPGPAGTGAAKPVVKTPSPDAEMQKKY